MKDQEIDELGNNKKSFVGPFAIQLDLPVRLVRKISDGSAGTKIELTEDRCKSGYLSRKWITEDAARFHAIAYI